MPHRSAVRPPFWAALAALLVPSAHADEPPPPRRALETPRPAMDEVLARPYGPEVPFGSTGARLWASSPQGWAFADDVHWVDLTNLHAFDLVLRDERGLLRPAKATYHPSHVHLEGTERAVQASASFTFATDNVQAPLTKPFDPEKRWTCWSSGRREDWYAVDFGAPRTLSGLTVFFFDDTGRGACRPPVSYAVERWSDGRWLPVASSSRTPEAPTKGENTVTFEPVAAERFRLVFHHAGREFYTGLYGLEPIGPDAAPAAGSPLEIRADKFITPDDLLVSIVRVRNPTGEARRFGIEPVVPWEGQFLARSMMESGQGDGGPRQRPISLWQIGRARLHEQDVRLEFRFLAPMEPPGPPGEAPPRIVDGPFPGFGSRPGAPRVEYVLKPGASIEFRAAMHVRLPGEGGLPAPDTLEQVEPGGGGGDVSRGPLDRIIPTEHLRPTQPYPPDFGDPLAAQVRAYQSWFDRNLAVFDCSDPRVRTMYYHRAYNLRKNMMEPRLGALAWPTQAEGRWRSGWYPNVISYGAGHQVREARWLRDPRYWQGHLRTWAENEKPDHVYPSHVTPKGPAGGQYTDWISSTAWDGHLVHPDRDYLAAIIDKLAANVRGWQSVYDPDGDGLLLVDSHWWTGMEYQPSFFYFSNYKVRPDFYEPPERVSLERVDLTAYNFGNAAAVARIYRGLGRPDEAKEFEALADKIRSAVAAKMWQPKGKFFYSLRASDDAVADVKEIVGVYPFYFGMFPAGSEYEAAWASVLDTEQFWTPWPVASASKQCPAYSQVDWPGDGRASACMWNGPTWPHANSIVLSAMARTLRADRDAGASSPLTREKLWELFASFTRAQYRDGDPRFPWTGEYYRGDTGAWKTRERDYNHSTWLDVLIPDLLGLVPRDDDVLEIDPLLPAGALSHFLLDGQHYRGHDVSLVWDAPGGEDRYGDGRKGFDVYLDGRRVASADQPGRLFLDLKAGAPVERPR